MEDIPERRRLVPLWVIWAGAAVLVVALVAAAVYLRSRQTSLVSVPNVVGLDLTVARSRLAEKGLALKRGDNRFSSTTKAGGVLEQSPRAGDNVPKGTPITVVVSAGSEAFALPDVTGMPLALARSTLQEKGLIVQTEVVSSSRAKGQVVSTTPAAGVTVSTTDVVKLQISSGGGGSGTLQPANLTGRVFVIDPAPVSGTTSDTPMELQRRLNSLLGASGAKVFVTRTIVDSVVTPELRAQRALQASATAVIGLDVAAEGPAGLAVSTMRSGTVKAGVYLSSVQLSQVLVASLQSVQPGTRSSETSADPVLVGADAPGARVRLGSLGQPKDVSNFADPAWSDSVARAIYAALAKVYGSK